MEIILENLSYKDILKKINYKFENKKITTIVSSSEEEREVLSEIIANINNDYQGKITNNYNGRYIGYIPEEYDNNFISNNVYEQIRLYINKYNYKIDEEEKRILDSLKIIGLPVTYLKRNISTLSSGEKKLLYIATILSVNPSIIIINEPYLNLDDKNKEKIGKVLKKLKTRYNKTIIILTSEIKHTLNYTDNYLLLKKGKVIYSGTNKELLNNLDKLNTLKVNKPEIIKFINMANKKKNANLDITFDIKELMKDIYRNVRG